MNLAFQKQYAERLRRMSTLSRSDAIQGYQPIKQTSNPLPQHPRIYERGHEHSRSWNVETGRESSPPLQSDYTYYQRNEIYPEERAYIPVINEPSSNHLSVRQFPRQAKSFDERSGSPRDTRRMSTDRRTVSLTRQSTAQHLQPETPVAAACQSLWAAKGHLEELHALGISDPSSASTSFESNTDNSPAPGNGAAGKAREEGADKKRLQYKEIFPPYGAYLAFPTLKVPNRRLRRTLNMLPEQHELQGNFMDANTKRRNFVTSDNKQFGRHVYSSPSRRSSQYSDASRELVELFSRRSSQDSRRTSSTVIGDTRFARDSNRNAISKNEWARFARDHPYEERRESTANQRFYDYGLPSKQSSESRLGCESRRSSHNVETREYFPARDYRNTYKYISNEENRRRSRELPPTPTVEVPLTKHAKTNRKFSNKLFGTSSLYERNETCVRCRRRRSFSRQSKSHDAMWATHDSPHNYVRSLFLRRKFLSTAAVSSMDSTNSTESSAPEAIFASSVDSAGSDLEHRRLSLLNRIPTGSVPHLNTRPYPNINPPPTSHRRRLNNRDYSVDAQSDTLFREWSRIDPAYEERDSQERRDIQNSRRVLGRGVSEDQALRPSRARVYSRQLTVNPGGNPLIPYIRYPDEMNCPR